jgi:phage terminase large subunit GpA-like protein
MAKCPKCGDIGHSYYKEDHTYADEFSIVDDDVYYLCDDCDNVVEIDDWGDYDREPMDLEDYRIQKGYV